MSRKALRLSARFLRLCAGPQWADSIEGDLEETHKAFGPREHGLSWGAVLPIALRLGRERVRVGARAVAEGIWAAVRPRGDGMLQGVWRDTRYSVRTMWRSPVFTVAVAVTLALGIGSSTALYSFIDAFLLRPLPFHDPDRLVHVWSTDRLQGDTALRSSLPDFEDWRAQSQTFEDMALFNYTESNVSSFDEPERIPTGVVTANAFALLGSEPVLGRGFLEGEDRLGAAPVAVLSQVFWQRRYGGDPDVLGKTIEMDERKYEIVGVMREDFAFPLNTTQLWRPYSLDQERYTRETRPFQVVGRLRPGVSRTEAQAELDAIARRIESEFPDQNRGRGVNVVPLRQALNFVADILDPMAALLTVAVILVLLITCANVASLLLSRATSRARELSIRAALGAGRGRVVRQLLTESAILALMGAALAILLARAILGWMDASIPLDLYRVGAIALDERGLAIAFLVALVSALGFGSLPALQASRLNLVDGLKEGGRGAGSGRGSSRAHAVLAVAQVSTAFVLLICAALVARSLGGMNDVPLGFDQRTVTAQILLTAERFQEPDAKRAFQRSVLEELRQQPGIGGASIVNFLPLNHETSMRGYRTADSATAGNAPPPRAIDLTVAPGYFQTMGIPLLQGRDFADADDASAPPVVIVNAALAAALSPEGSAMGHELRLVDGNEEILATVVGIVADTRHMRLADPPERILYVPQYQEPWRYMRVLARTGQSERASELAIRDAVARVDPTLPVTEFRSMARVARDFLIPQRMLAGALTVLGAAALLLAIVGIYGVLAQHVAGRTQEIGVRMALGATRMEVLTLVLRRGSRLTAVGAAIGIAASLVTARLLESFMFGISTTDVPTLLGVALALGGTAILACAIPALRAARVDPLEALRHE